METRQASMELAYETLIRDLATHINSENMEMCLITLLAMQEIRLFINYSKETWSDEELREMLRNSLFLIRETEDV